MNPLWKYGVAMSMAVACSVVAVVVLLHPSKPGEAQTIDFWSLTPPTKQVFLDQNPQAFEPRLTQQHGMVLHVRTTMVGDPPGSERLYEAFATVEGDLVPVILTREVSSSGAVIAEQLTNKGRTTLEDGHVIGDGKPNTLAQLLPAMDPEFARSVLHLSEATAAGSSTRSFTVTSSAPGERFRREVEIDALSHVILSHRLIEVRGSKEVVLDSSSITFEWIPIEQAPQALVEVTAQ